MKAVNGKVGGGGGEVKSEASPWTRMVTPEAEWPDKVSPGSRGPHDFLSFVFLSIRQKLQKIFIADLHDSCSSKTFFYPYHFLSISKFC
jgi:hypothetical protein